MRIIISFMFSMVTILSCAQPGFFAEYSANGSDFAQGVVQLADSSYVITGASSSFPGGQTQAYLLKIDSVGNYIWSKPYGGAETDWMKRVFHIDGVGFSMAGFTSSFGVQGYDIYVIGTDLNGDMLYEKTYGGEGWERTNDAAKTSDNGMMIVGETNSNPTANKDVYILRTDVLGDTIWTTTMGDLGDDYGTAITPVSDTTFMIATASFNEDSLVFKTVMYLMQDDKTILWQDTIDYIGELIINDVLVYNDTMQVVGQQRLNDTDDWDIYRMTYDLINDIVVQVYNEHHEGNSRGKELVKRDTSPYRMMAWGSDSDVSFAFGEDVVVHRQDQLMNYLWVPDSYVAREGQDEVGEFIRTNDGGAMLVGYVSHRDGQFNEHVFVYKFGPDGTGVWVDETGVVNQMVGLHKIDHLAQFSVYPNPANDKIVVETEQQISHLKLIALDGKLIKSQSDFAGSIDVSTVQSGVYIIEVSLEDGAVGVQRVVIQ